MYKLMEFGDWIIDQIYFNWKNIRGYMYIKWWFTFYGINNFNRIKEKKIININMGIWIRIGLEEIKCKRNNI